MDKKLTLGSLFSGSGGFEFGGMLCGIEPLWASEVEPFPIRVTTKRFPNMKHYGDINKINGAEVPPVDVITFGSPCQDISVAGRRAGLEDGKRSSLFYEAVRIIKEMRLATDGQYPTYAVWENVPGAYSSNKGRDFKSVLEAFIHIKDETLSVPLPEKGKWSTAGEIVGDGFSIGWRTLDAQFWGVAQRRRRCYIVVDFNGERAGEILFDESRLRGNPPQGGFARQATAGGSAIGAGSAVAFEPGACSRLGGHCWDGEPTGALRADMGDNQLAVAIENHPADSRIKLSEDGIVQTLSERMGTGGGNVPLVMSERERNMTVSEDVAGTLLGTDYKGVQCVCEPAAEALCAAFMGGQGSKARSIAYHEETAPTLRSEAGGNSVPMTVYGICSKNSNSMLSPNPHSGIYEAETARTLDTSVPDPNKNAGGMAVVALEGNGSRPSHRGDGFSDEDISYTLNSVERHSVCYQDKVGSLCASDYKFPQQQQVEEGKAVVEQTTSENRYIVRRLVPTECARLQGFPDWWCADLGTPDPAEDDIAFWSEVWETDRHIKGASSKPKTRNQLIKWLKNPYSDAASYKMWGNGICLWCAVFVLGGIAHYSRDMS